MEGLAWLKIDWPILDLQQNISRELAVKRLKIFIGSARAVVPRLHVINKRAPDYDSVIRGHRGSQHVRAIGMRALVGAWPGLAFAIGLDKKTAEVGNQLVD